MTLTKGDRVYSLGYRIPDHCEDLGVVQMNRNQLITASFPYLDNPRKTLIVIAPERTFEKEQTP